MNLLSRPRRPRGNDGSRGASESSAPTLSTRKGFPHSPLACSFAFKMFKFAFKSMAPAQSSDLASNRFLLVPTLHALLIHSALCLKNKQDCVVNKGKQSAFPSICAPRWCLQVPQHRPKTLEIEQCKNRMQPHDPFQIHSSFCFCFDHARCPDQGQHAHLKRSVERRPAPAKVPILETGFLSGRQDQLRRCSIQPDRYPGLPC